MDCGVVMLWRLSPSMEVTATLSLSDVPRAARWRVTCGIVRAGLANGDTPRNS